VPSHEGHAREAKDVPEWEVQNKIPKKIRLVYVGMPDIASVHKWYAHDQFKPENQVKEYQHKVLRRPAIANCTKR
jgi:hypothetical protein